MARALNADQTSKPRRVLQVFHAGDIGEAAAAALHGALAGSDVQTAERSFSGKADAQHLAALIKAAGPRDAWPGGVGMIEHQLISGYYPRLALAPNERFASKGGHLVHFTQPSGAQVLADTEWLVP